MTTEKHFSKTVRDWADIFMHRSLRDFAHFMHTAGLSMPQVNTLMRLYYEDTCGVSDIGQFLGVSNAAASQMIDRMVQQGLLERTEHADDRRIRQLSLTAKGRTLLEQGIEARHHWLTELPAQLTPEQQTTIVAGLASLTEAARHLEDTHPARKKTGPAGAPAPKHRKIPTVR